jgi:cysteinyl-tRNA synthetase
MLSTHYRKPMDWTQKKREEAEKTLRKWYAQAERALDNEKPYKPVVDALRDDLNTAGALAQLHQLSHKDDVPALRASLRFLGLMGDHAPGWVSNPTPDLTAVEDLLANARTVAMQTKDFSEVDRLKSALVDAGVEVRMSKDGVDLVPGPGFDPAKLEALK